MWISSRWCAATSRHRLRQRPVRFRLQYLRGDLAINRQSGDIAMGVDTGGAGDQGMMFGYATNETAELMPAPISLAHKLSARLSEVRKSGQFSYLRPDGKSQVRSNTTRTTSRCASTRWSSRPSTPSTSATSSCARDILKHVIQAVIPANLLDENTKYHINPTGRFVIGGPMGDTGLTGRKIIVDTYGGMGRHGGGAFQRQGPDKGGPLGGLHGALHCEEHRGRRSG